MNGSEDLYRLLAESLPEGVSLQDLQGRLVYANPSLLRLTGLAREDLLGREVDHLAHPEDRENLRQATREAARAGAGGPPTEVEWRCRRADGSYQWFWTVNQRVEAGGSPLGVLSSSRDVTARRAAEGRREQAATMEAVGRLAGGVAHDFNNLLTVIAGYSALLLESSEPGREGYDALGEIQRAADRAAGLTRQLLAFSRRPLANPVALDLNGLLRNLEPALRGLVGPAVRLSLGLDPGLRRVRADPGQMEQVLFNLAANARAAMPEGGQFVLTTADAGPDVRLTARDTGRGLDEAALAHVFEPFFTTGEVGPGPGLGLAAVYGIVQQCGGRIEARSEPGRGTFFTLDLPAAPGAPLAGGPPGGGGETVLIVDDEAAVRSVTRQVLQEEGYTVLEAADGREALRVFDQHPGPVHLLLTDVLMPRLSGPEVARRLLERSPDLRVLFMSGYTAEAALPRQPPPGTKAELLVKPFRLPELLRMVREALAPTSG